MYTAACKETKQIAKVLVLLTKAGIKFVPEASFRNTLRISKRKTF